MTGGIKQEVKYTDKEFEEETQAGGTKCEGFNMYVVLEVMWIDSRRNCRSRAGCRVPLQLSLSFSLSPSLQTPVQKLGWGFLPPPAGSVGAEWSRDWLLAGCLVSTPLRARRVSGAGPVCALVSPVRWGRRMLPHGVTQLMGEHAWTSEEVLLGFFLFLQ